MVQFRHLVFGLGTLPNLVRYMEVVGWTRLLSLCLYTSLEHSTGSLFSTCLFLTLSWSFTFSVIRLFSYLCSVHLCFRCVLWHIWFICMCDGLWRLWLHHWQNMLSVASVFLFHQTLLRMNVARHTFSLQLPFCHVLFVFGALPLSLVLGELVACWSCHSSVSVVCVSL